MMRVQVKYTFEFPLKQLKMYIIKKKKKKKISVKSCIFQIEETKEVIPNSNELHTLLSVIKYVCSELSNFCKKT